MNAGRQSGARDAANQGAKTDASPNTALRRLLLPIDATARSRWGIAYARALRRRGQAIEATLLSIGEPVTNWEVLRFRTHDEIARFQAERARYFLEEAAQPLTADGIPCRTLFREGEVVFEILDAAEQLDCTEIVLPAPAPRLIALFSDDTVRKILRQQRGIPVVIVDENGLPDGHRAN
jgi:hypothetical protein